MIKKIILFALLLVVTSLYIGCSDDDDDGVTNTTPVSPVGEWALSLPAGMLSEDQPATDVVLTVGESTFSIVVSQLLFGTVKTTVYSSSGTADISGDPVVLTGENCLILDPTSGTLVSLELVAPGACATPVSVSTDGLESDTWTIAGAQLVPAMPFLSTEQQAAVALAILPFNKK